MARPPRSLSLPTILAVLVAVSTTAVPSHAETWTIASGFSETTNPNGSWTYGYQVSPGTALSPFTNRIESGGIDVWCMNDNPDAAGNVNANLTTAPIDMSGMWWDAGGMAMHPGPNGERAIVRWTAPQSMIATIDVTFAGANYAQGATTDVHVLLNDTSLFDGTVSGFGLGGPHGVSGSSPSQSYNGRVFVAAGDRIDFVVGPGGNGFGYDLTGISGSVTSMTGYGILRGTVTAGTSGGPLAGAVVGTTDGSVSATSGADGSYELLLPVGAHSIGATYPGAVSPVAVVTIAETQIATQDFELTPGTGLVYYVSPTGSDSNDGRSTASAWKTISRGDQTGVLQPGDIVAVMPGTYKPADFWGVRLVNCNGTADKPILYKALGQVLIDQTETARPADGVTYGIRVEVNNVTIEGFEITGSQWGIYFNDGYSGNSAIGNVIHGIRAANPNQLGFPGWCGGICNSVASGNLNRNNLIYDIGDPAVANIAACIASPIATDTRIVNNTLIGARTGVEVWAGGTRQEVINNIITDMRSEAISGMYREVTAFQHSHNLFYGNTADYGSGIVAGINESVANPNFVDPVNHDYRLLAGSPAVDSGLDLGWPFYGAAPDLGAFESTPEIQTSRLSDLKNQAVGTRVTLTQPKAVTFATGTLAGGVIYLEEPNRSAGIKAVAPAGISLAIGDRVTFSGTIGADANSEKIVNIISVISNEAGLDIRALGIGGSSVAKGLAPHCLLVKVWGWVTYKAPDSSFVYIDDGSDATDATGRTGLRIDLSGRVFPLTNAPPLNRFIYVTGVACHAADGNVVVPAIKPRTESDIYVSARMPDESKLASQWIAANLGPEAVSRPFSFTYNGVSSSQLLPTWQQDYSVQKLDAQRTQFTMIYTDRASGLQVRCVGIEYSDFPTVEWTVYFKNTGSTDTAIIENIQSLDSFFDRSGDAEFVLHHNVGSPCTAYDYRPIDTTMGPGSLLRIAGAGGRPTNSDLPYFNLESPGSGGVIVVVGWPGQWAAQFTRNSGASTRIVAGQELTHLKLHPGEEIRTPLMVLQFYTGDRQDAQNKWRRWMLAHNVPRVDGEVPPTIYFACSSHQYGEMINANEENQKYFISRYLEEQVYIDYWWMDAGWYINSWGWPNTGTWEVDPVRFPNGLRAITDYAHERGVKSIVWFEPERVTADTWLTINHPEWILGGAGGGLLNLGNPETWNWLVNHIDGLLVSEGIDLYRQDFNMDPLGYWRSNDAADRQGITENKHVVGYLAYWDELKRRHPGMLIDSCASGGRRNDLETMRRAIPLLRSDYITEPVGQQNHTYGIASWLPYFGTGGQQNDNYSFRSAFGTNFIACYDMRNLELDYNSVRRLYAQWRQATPYMLGDYYPLTPYSEANNVWMGWQFHRDDLNGGIVQVFRRGDSTQSSLTVYLRGLDPAADYTWTNIDTGQSQTLSGSQLMDTGIAISIPGRPEDRLFMYQKQ